MLIDYLGVAGQTTISIKFVYNGWGGVGGDLEAGIIRCLDREIGTRVGGGKSGRGEGDEDQCVREQWSSRRQVVKRLEPGGRHQRLAPDIWTRRTAPDIWHQEIGTRYW